MRVALMLSFIHGALAWTVDLGKVVAVPDDEHLAPSNLSPGKELRPDDTEYARNEEEQDFWVENEMSEVVQNGSEYLEAIGRSFGEYKDALQHCITINETRGESEESGGAGAGAACAGVLRDSGDVKRLVAALFSATGDLRERGDSAVKVEEELTALVRVAWLLDRLARLTERARVAAADSSDASSSGESSEILDQAEARRGARRGTRRRRGADPLREVASYYLKYKAWVGSAAPAAAPAAAPRADLDDNRLPLAESADED